MDPETEKIMSYADLVFRKMCQDILENGCDTKGELVRPHWPDGEKAYTVKKFGVVNRYDISAEFPVITFRRTALKSCMDEILWIWQKKSSNIRQLKSHIWDEWADEDGSIGKAYGYQMGVKHAYRGVREEVVQEVFHMDEIPVFSFSGDHASCASFIRGSSELQEAHVLFNESDQTWWMDQTDRVLYDLKANPYSRRIMTNLYTHSDLSEMALYPCAYSMTFNVTRKPGCERLVLNAVLNQRSQDVLTAGGSWNPAQYAILLMMFAQVSDMECGELMHVIADAHIYDRHIPIIRELIERETYPAPTVSLDPSVKDFYAFTTDHLRVENYQTGPQVKDIPVAI